MLSQEEILNAPLAELIDMAVETYGSEENRRRLHDERRIRMKVGIGRPVYGNAFGSTMAEYYSDAETCLTLQLRWKLFNFYHLRDDTAFNLLVGQEFSTAYEPSMFGIEYFIEEGKDPTYGKPVIIEREDLASLSKPDFYTSGMMPRVHSVYRDMKTLCGDKLTVFMQGWARGPWSIATMIRGFNDLLVDCLDEPDFVKEMMRFIVDCRLSWETQRCEFLGITPQDESYRWMYCLYRQNWNSDIFEDEVDGTLFSPEMHHELVIPYQKMMSDFYGGVAYYHSCGDLTNFLADIMTLNIKYVQHISSWTDFRAAAETVSPHVILQCSLNATDDVLIASEDHMRSVIRRMIDNSMGRTIDICPDALYVGGWDTLDKVKTMIRIFREEYPASAE